jgi:hypothetical protein
MRRLDAGALLRYPGDCLYQVFVMSLSWWC